MPRETPLRNLYKWLTQHPGADWSTIQKAHKTLPAKVLDHRLLLLELGQWIEVKEGGGRMEYWACSHC